MFQQIIYLLFNKCILHNNYRPENNQKSNDLTINTVLVSLYSKKCLTNIYYPGDVKVKKIQGNMVRGQRVTALRW